MSIDTIFIICWIMFKCLYLISFKHGFLQTYSSRWIFWHKRFYVFSITPKTFTVPLDNVVVSHDLWRCIFSFDLVLCLVTVLIVPGGFKGGWRFIVLRFLPPLAELADPSPVFEKRGARVADLSPWLDTRPPDLLVLAGKAEILARSPPPLPFGTRVPDCSLAGELVVDFFAGRELLVSSSELSSLKVILLLIVSISISFLSSFKAADCRADSVFGIVVSFFCSGVVCGGGGVSSEEGASRGTGFFLSDFI